MNTKTKTNCLTQCAVMIALAVVLSKIEIPLWAQGGSLTLASMVPIILLSYRLGTKWGFAGALGYSLIQMMLGFSNVMYCPTLGTQILCILLDYVIAYSCLGLASLLGKALNSKKGKILLGTALVCFIRFICHYISGIVLWGSYAPEGTPVWIYSLTYNGGYMLPESIITIVVMLALSKFIPDNN